MQFAQQSGILDRDHRLVGKSRSQRDLLFSKRLDPLAAQVDRADQRSLTHQRHPELGADFG